MACDLIPELIYHDGRKTKQVPSPIRMDGRRMGIKEQAPLLGQHTDETLRELGYTSEEIRALRESKAI